MHKNCQYLKKEVRWWQLEKLLFGMALTLLLIFSGRAFASDSVHSISVVNNSQQNKKFSLVSGSGQYEFSLPETGSGAIDGENFTALYITGHFSDSIPKSEPSSKSRISSQILTAPDSAQMDNKQKSDLGRPSKDHLSNSDQSTTTENSNSQVIDVPGPVGSIDTSGNSESASDSSGNENDRPGSTGRPHPRNEDLGSLGSLNESNSNSGADIGPGAGQGEQGASGSALTVSFRNDHLDVAPNVAVAIRGRVDGADLTNLRVHWSFLDGPIEPTIQDPDAVSTIAIFPEAGEYTLSLQASTDSENASAILTVSVVALRPQILYVSANSQAEAPDGSAEFPFKTIQDAVNAAGSNAQIQVSQGIYSGSNDSSTFVVDIDSKSNLTIIGGYEAPGVGESDPMRFPTVIDGQNVARNRFLMRIIDSSGSLSGFEFRGATGGALKINRAPFKIEKCYFHDNQNSRPEPNTAGAIYVTQSDGVMIGYSRFASNSSEAKGGAVRVDNSNVYLYASYFFGNHSVLSGGAVHNFGAVLHINHSTFAGNRSDEDGAGDTIHNEYGSLELSNSILWNGTETLHSLHLVDMESSSVVRYSIVQYGFEGEGNLSNDPVFAGLDTGILHLTAHSPAIEAGDPMFVESELEMTDGEGDPRRVGGRVDMGFDEYSSARGDMNRDGELNDQDIDLFTEALSDPANYRINYPGLNPLIGDMTYDGRLDNFDIDPFMCAVTGNC